MNIDEFIRFMKAPRAELTNFCKIKKYIKIEDKFKFIEELNTLVEQHISEFKHCQELALIVFFDLLVVKYYTNIEDIELNNETYDKLQENDLISKIMKNIGQDCLLLQGLLQSTIGKK